MRRPLKFILGLPATTPAAIAEKYYTRFYKSTPELRMSLHLKYHLLIDLGEVGFEEFLPRGTPNDS